MQTSEDRRTGSGDERRLGGIGLYLRAVRYGSARSIDDGSSRAARRAGPKEARATARQISTKLAAKDAGSSTETLSSARPC
jgi:hypothetical protein